MTPDTGAIRALASGLRDQSEEVRREAGRLVALLDGAHWTGRAADAARQRARERAGDLAATAALHDRAGDALLRHAREVEDRLALIARAERRAVEALRDLADGPVGWPDRWPSPGSPDWLDADLGSLLRSAA